MPLRCACEVPYTSSYGMVAGTNCFGLIYSKSASGQLDAACLARCKLGELRMNMRWYAISAGFGEISSMPGDCQYGGENWGEYNPKIQPALFYHVFLLLMCRAVVFIWLCALIKGIAVGRSGWHMRRAKASVLRFILSFR